MVAAAYDLANLHSSRFNTSSSLTQSNAVDYSHPISNQTCSNGNFNLTNSTLSSWEEAHQSAAAFAACHYHNFSNSCDFINTLNFSDANLVPCGSIPTMTISRVSGQSGVNRSNSETASGFQINRSSINTNCNTVKYSKPRRRVATMAQRRAANIRERRRMFHLNTAFDKLRKKVPTFAYEKRLSRIETLRLAMMYISFMTEVLREFKDSQLRLPLHPNSGSFNNHQLDNIWEPSISVSDSNRHVIECNHH